MATITGFTADRMLAIEDNSIVDGDVVGDNLILTKHNGTTINAGSVRGPTGSPGITAPELAAGLAGAATVTQMNTEITNRTNGDNTLTTNLNAEITNRVNAVNAEATIRATYADGHVTQVLNSTTGLSTTQDGSMKDIPGSTISFAAVGGRKYRLVAQVNSQFSGSVSGSPAQATIAIVTSAGAGVFAKSYAVGDGGGGRANGTIEFVITAPSTGTLSYKLQHYGQGTSISYVNPLNYAAGTFPWLVFDVYDVGS